MGDEKRSSVMPKAAERLEIKWLGLVQCSEDFSWLLAGVGRCRSRHLARSWGKVAAKVWCSGYWALVA